MLPRSVTKRHVERSRDIFHPHWPAAGSQKGDWFCRARVNQRQRIELCRRCAADT